MAPGSRDMRVHSHGNIRVCSKRDIARIGGIGGDDGSGIWKFLPYSTGGCYSGHPNGTGTGGAGSRDMRVMPAGTHQGLLCCGLAWVTQRTAQETG